MDPSEAALIVKMYESVIDPSSRALLQREMASLFNSREGDRETDSTLGSTPSLGGFGPAPLDLAVHAVIASRIKKQFEALENRCELWSVVFASISMKAILVGTDLSVKSCSAAGQDLLNTRDGLNIVNGKLVASQHDYTIELRNRVKAAPPSGVPKKGFMSIPRVLNGHLLLSFVSLHAPGVDSETITLVQVVDANQPPRIHRDDLSKLFGMTKAEAALACELASGITLEEASRKLIVSSNTVKTHLKRIFRKTNTSRQSELVALLLRIATIC